MIVLKKQHLVYMNIGKKYWSAAVEGFTADQKAALKGYLENIENMIRKGTGVYLWGENGVGKSYVSAALCKRVWGKYRVTSYCITASELKEGWVENIPAHEGSEEAIRERVTGVRFLVLDDVGKEYRANSGFIESTIAGILRGRIRAKKTTVMTSNLNPAKFKEVYGSSMAEIASESMLPIRLKGDNMRSAIAESIHQDLKGKSDGKGKRKEKV